MNKKKNYGKAKNTKKDINIKKINKVRCQGKMAEKNSHYAFGVFSQSEITKNKKQRKTSDFSFCKRLFSREGIGYVLNLSFFFFSFRLVSLFLSFFSCGWWVPLQSLNILV